MARAEAEAASKSAGASRRVTRAKKAQLSPSKQVSFALKLEAAGSNKAERSALRHERALERLKVEMRAFARAGQPIPANLRAQAAAHQAAATRLRATATQSTAAAGGFASMVSPANLAKVASVGMAVEASRRLVMLVHNVATTNDEIAKLARRAGISAAAMSELGFAARRSGGTVEDVSKAFARLSNNAVSNSSEFRRWGITLRDTNGRTKSTNELFLESAELIASLESPTLKAAAAQQLMGRSALNLLPLLNEGADGIRELRERADELGLSIDDAAAATGEGYADALEDLSAAVTGFVQGPSTGLANALTGLISLLADVIAHLGKANRFIWRQVDAAGELVKAYTPLGWAYTALTDDGEDLAETQDKIAKKSRSLSAAVWEQSHAFTGLRDAMQSARTASERQEKDAQRRRKRATGQARAERKRLQAEAEAAASDGAQVVRDIMARVFTELPVEASRAAAEGTRIIQETMARVDRDAQDRLKARIDANSEAQIKRLDAEAARFEVHLSEQHQRAKSLEEERQRALVSLAGSVGSAVGSAVGEIARTGELSRDIIQGLAQDIARMAAQAGLRMLMQFAFGGGGAGGAGAAGFVQGLLGFNSGGFVPAFSSGGFVSGGMPGRDSVPAMLTPGERVLSVPETKALRSLLSDFPTGGGSTTIVNVNTTVPQTAAQYEKTLKTAVEPAIRRAQRRKASAAGKQSKIRYGQKGLGEVD